MFKCCDKIQKQEMFKAQLTIKRSLPSNELYADSDEAPVAKVILYTLAAQQQERNKPKVSHRVQVAMITGML